MKTLFIIQAVLNFIQGYSKDSMGSFFTPGVKSLISLLSVGMGLACIIVSLIKHFWWGILIAIAICLVFTLVGAITLSAIRNRVEK